MGTIIKELNGRGNIYIEGTHTRPQTSRYGLQSLGLKLNDNGIPTALADANTLSFVNNDSGFMNTQWTPDLNVYSIEYNCAGSLEVLDASGAATGSRTDRTEKREITHHAVDGNKYYINDVLQPYTPAFPDDTTVININDTAVIGYPDKVDTVINPFRAYSINSKGE